MGYTGGTSANPTYRRMGDHTETVRIEFDPRQIGYQALLDRFWSAHDPTRKTWRRQYMSAIFVYDPDQEADARAGVKRESQRRQRPVATRILPATEFYSAEFYHQKYFLQKDRLLMDAMRAVYPENTDLIDSTVAARLNGYLGGYGGLTPLRREIGEFGLSEPARRHLLEKVGP